VTSRAEIAREDTSRVTRCSWPACPERGTWRFTGPDGFGGTVRGWLCEDHLPNPNILQIGGHSATRDGHDARCPCGERLPCAMADVGYPWCVNCLEHHRHPELCELDYAP